MMTAESMMSKRPVVRTTVAFISLLSYFRSIPLCSCSAYAATMRQISVMEYEYLKLLATAISYFLVMLYFLCNLSAVYDKVGETNY